MKKPSFASHLCDTTSMLALSAAALLASSGTPASAQATRGIYAAGSTLAAQAFRQIFDCYTGATVGGDGFTFTTSFPGPGKLPATCTTPAQAPAVQGMVAGVGSGNGMRGYVSNNSAQWYGGRVTPNNTVNTLIATPLPAIQPPFVDSANSTNFGTYPYPRLDIGLSETPLPGTLAGLTTVSFSFTPTQSWSTPGGALAQITLNSATAVAAYASTVYGQPIQVPAFEINVAIPVNVNSALFTINSQIKSGGNIVQGGAIQLTTAQMCAIFSGLVTNWADGLNATFPNTTIPYLDHTGWKTAKFDYANVGNDVSIAQPYATANLPIKVVYMLDESGESYILTNYLKAVCPQLDPTGTYKYQSIFGAANLPSTSFSVLISNIVNARGNGPWNLTTVAGAWIPVIGSGGVAATISDGPEGAGRIGYVGANFTRPYAQTVSGAGLTNVNAPHAAALQNEYLRINGADVPNTWPLLTFIAPTPASADAAWNDTRLQVPNTTWTWADYNIYNNLLPIPTVQGSVTLSGKPVLPLTNVVGAYPLSGTTFMNLYSCYNVQGTSNSSRVFDLRNFLNWYMDTSVNANAKLVVESNGFHLLPDAYSVTIVTQYLTTTQPGVIQQAKLSNFNNGGCTGLASGIGDGKGLSLGAR